MPPSPLSPSEDHRDTTETLETLVIPTTEAMKLSYDVKYMSTGTETRMAGLMDLEAYVDEYWDDRDGGVACVEARMECVGPWSLSVEKVRLVRKVREFPFCLVSSWILWSGNHNISSDVVSCGIAWTTCEGIRLFS